MDIIFASRKLRNQCNDHRLTVKTWGMVQAKKLGQRLDDLKAAATLEVMRSLPGRCHEMKGNRAGQLSLDLEHPYRLVFKPANHPISLKEDGGLDWGRVTSVLILGVEDTHG